MRVHPKQLEPKCVLLQDIYGKGNYPIVPKKTVLSETHIDVLIRFSVLEVEVAKNLANGLTFFPQPLAEEDKLPQKKTLTEQEPEPVEFTVQYQEAVSQYQKMFTEWQSGVPLDIHAVRQLILPLLEEAEANQLTILLLASRSNKSEYIYHHSIAISLLTALLAKRLGYQKDWIQVSLAAFIADSGMAKVSPRILKKELPLTPPEKEEVEKHPTFSYRNAQNCPSLSKAAKLGVIQHHEYLDGSGYPLGVKADKIHPYAKMIAITDSYHAMTSERFYRHKKPFFAVIPEMRQKINHQFDPEFLNAFIQLLEETILDQPVYLTNGQSGRVVSLSLDDHPEVLVQVHETQDVISIADQNKVKIDYFI
ncbi:HD-GYP domain-containing protein (c-di-GMP phosphodiesterase class II) [Streptohalobacillus salinus]|uniref:HD-GYP domain-containing protein (C-di-GMP phosphodiesterase class II) n=1 Tax=Streptohalobacillus salinus TaxID=621096 RepID=A0A2V3W627_9BACI|nr:HD-GYP domain-containing protein [Streptohalobacillus salinus]PXW89823.1 HD-GYP domain-containing protein (c-di-GMP phosphodiesterase class II) [Streptohalobacillus salinus]